MKRFLLAYLVTAGAIALYAWQTAPEKHLSDSSVFAPAPTISDYAAGFSVTMLKALPGLLVVVFVLWLLSRVWTHVHYAAPDSAGRLPIPRSELPGVATSALASYHVTELERARNQQPERFTYAPHLRLQNGATLSHDVTGLHDATPNAPTFAQLLAGGQIGKDAPLILGYTDDGPVQGTRQEITALAIGGKSQTGKSTTTRYIAANLALQGCKFIVCDPHGRAQGEARDKNLAATLAPLRSAFLCDVAIDEGEILNAVSLAHRIFQQRKQGMPADFPLLLIIDEFSAVMRNAELARLLMPLLEAFPTEAPKFDVSGLFLGQQWEPSRCGGKVFQRALGGAYLHRMHPESARMLCGIRDPLLSTVATLPAGQALLYRTTGSFDRVSVPNTSTEDLSHVAALLGRPDGVQMASIVDVDAKAVQTPKPRSAQDARIVSLFQQGADVADIVRDVFGVVPKQGRAYQLRSAEVQKILREAM